MANSILEDYGLPSGQALAFGSTSPAKSPTKSPTKSLMTHLAILLAILFGLGIGPAFAQEAAQQTPSPKTRQVEGGVWLLVTTPAPSAQPVAGAKIALNGKRVGLTSAKGRLFIPKAKLFNHAVVLTAAKSGYQSSRSQVMLRARPPKSSPYGIILHPIPTRLGGSEVLAKPTPQASAKPQADAKLQAVATKMVKAGPAEPAPKPEPELKPELKPEPLADKLYPLVSQEPSQSHAARSKSPANTPLPRLKIQLVTKPSKGQTKAEAKVSYHGVIGELRYSSPKGRVEYCDLSGGWCQFSLGKGLQPHRLTITSPRFVPKSFRIRSKKSQTVVVSLIPHATTEAAQKKAKASAKTSAKTKAKTSAKTRAKKQRGKKGSNELAGYGRSYAQLSPLPRRPQLMAADGPLRAAEVTNLLRYGRTTPPSSAKKAEPALTWPKVKVAAAGYVAIRQDGSADLRSLAKAAAGPEPLPALGFVDTHYRAPRVTAISLGRPVADAKSWAKIDASWQNSDYLSWLPHGQLKADLAQQGRSLLAWLMSDIGSNGYEAANGVDFAIVLAPIHELAAARPKSGRFLALLRHNSGAILAAKIYSSGTAAGASLGTAIAEMVGHIPFEVAAIASKDGDIAINMPKGLFTRLFPKPAESKTNGSDGAAFQLRRIQAGGTSHALMLEPYASYPRMSYFSPLPLIEGSGVNRDRLRVGQRFIINQSFAAVQTQEPLPKEPLPKEPPPKEPRPEEPRPEELQWKDAKGHPLEFALTWTEDGTFAVADINGVVPSLSAAKPSRSALKAIAGWFHPSTGAYATAAQLQLSQGAPKTTRQVVTVTAPKLLEITTTPVPAQITVAKQPLGLAPLAAYPPRPAAQETKLLPFELAPVRASAASAYKDITTKILAKTLRSSQDYPLILRPDHLHRIKALLASDKPTEATRYIATLPRSIRRSFPMAFVAATIKAKQQDYKGCHRAFQQLSRKAKSSQPLAQHVASVLNESICLSHMMMTSSSLKRLKPTLASIKAVRARVKKALAASKAAGNKSAATSITRSTVELATLEFYGSHLKYLHWHATQDSRYLDQAVRGYRYYLSLVKDAPKRPAEGISVNAAQYQLQAKKVIAMVDR